MLIVRTFTLSSSLLKNEPIFNDTIIVLLVTRSFSTDSQSLVHFEASMISCSRYVSMSRPAQRMTSILETAWLLL